MRCTFSVRALVCSCVGLFFLKRACCGVPTDWNASLLSQQMTCCCTIPFYAHAPLTGSAPGLSTVLNVRRRVCVRTKLIYPLLCFAAVPLVFHFNNEPLSAATLSLGCCIAFFFSCSKHPTCRDIPASCLAVLVGVFGLF